MLQKISIKKQPYVAQKKDFLYIGIDVGKKHHRVAFLSRPLLAQYQRIDDCPAFAIEQSRLGFEHLIDQIRIYVPDVSNAFVILEHTGHYHRPLRDFLSEQGITVYEVRITQRQLTHKNDRRDALHLANILYNQMELKVQSLNTIDKIHKIIPPTSEAVALRPLVQHRLEVSRSETMLRNRLTAISDELFPELATCMKDVNCAFALRLRERFATASEIAQAHLEDLYACRTSSNPSNKVVLKLHEAAKRSIGISSGERLRGLLLEQKHLISALQLLKEQLHTIEMEITTIIGESRAGQILCSIPGIQAITAATIVAMIGNIENFDSASKLRGYFGWAPVAKQSGTSLDTSALSTGGNRVIKQIIYLAAWHVVVTDTEWRDIYERLIPLKCSYDDRLGKYRGKNKIIGRIAGQIIGIIWTLLRKDYDRLAALRPGEEEPEPILYSRETHNQKRRH